jgi:esterase/lipase superfamily enzyme
MSDRAFFWDAEKISNRTAFYQNSNPETILESKEIENKNILLLVHGYNNDAAQALSTYQLINVHVSEFKDGRDSKFYDLVIGYLWPGDDSGLEYYDAKSHVSKTAPKMRSHLEFLSASAAKVDVLAHSMGNLFVLEALNYQSSPDKKILQNFYSIAPAVDDESVEKKGKYYFSTQNCDKVFVFFSKRDEVLKWLYSFAEWDLALGYEGAEAPNKLPPNVQLINYTNSISNHSQYFTYLPFYEFIKQQFLLEPVPVLKTQTAEK